jgi:hypothetical protein
MWDYDDDDFNPDVHFHDYKVLTIDDALSAEERFRLIRRRLTDMNPTYTEFLNFFRSSCHRADARLILEAVRMDLDTGNHRQSQMYTIYDELVAIYNEEGPAMADS